jgi:CelD/BcsL family acetyltransferase involved in cellulose biosynthesis
MSIAQEPARTVEVGGLDPRRGLRHVELMPHDPRWQHFVARHPESLPIHEPVWSTMMAEACGGTTVVLGVQDESGTLVGGTPIVVTRRRGLAHAVSLPGTDFCQPLVRHSSIAPVLADGILERVRPGGWDTCRVKWPVETIDGEGPRLVARGFRHVTPLESDASRVFARFKKSQVQQRVRRAERLGVRIRPATGDGDFETFVAMHTRIRSGQGALVEPRRLLRGIYERVIMDGGGSLLVGEHEDRPVCAAMFLHGNAGTYYLYGAYAPEARALRANNLLLWTAIRDACERGEPAFDWGFSDADNRGLRDFKRGWGADEIPFHSIHVEWSPTAHGSIPGSAVPDLGPWLGTVILRSPPWLCRALSELLYWRLD